MCELAQRMTPRRFAYLAGAVLILLGLAGLSGMLGQISSASFFHPPYWINSVYFAFWRGAAVSRFQAGHGCVGRLHCWARLSARR